ncbi:phosphoribosylglycinamide formyltransferase [Membranihabitans marinus]|uniref:phosphoribosylglycinamide formyltransferase n=1 Tax=Membranihabitans marinus TaxID=1227546 RepID=UPI001F1E8857|nr:phosphoribosylglycinamide formyltransferase [Membranihabitans marinus]
MKQIAIFASGSGSNAEKILQYFEFSTDIKVALIVTNNANAGVLEHGKNWKVDVEVIGNSEWKYSQKVLPILEDYGIDFIVLAGFLRKIPNYLLQAYPDKIVNIHPALLPAYGGKGMYGMHVHKAVHKAGEKVTGITIHMVNEVYDAGEMVFQAQCEILADESPQDIQKKVLTLEHRYFPVVVEYLVKGEQVEINFD